MYFDNSEIITPRRSCLFPPVTAEYPGKLDDKRIYIYKGAMSNNADSVSLTSMVNSGSITPPAINKTFSHTVDFSSDNAFAEDDCLYIWLKKDSTSANQDLYFNINVNGEYS